MPPHNLTFTLIGACLLWVGWFGFNAGSNLEANGIAAEAVLNTIVAAAAAALAWMFAEWGLRGHPSLLGAASGAVAGLVAVTPASGFAGPLGAIVIGVVAGVVCLWAVVWLKNAFRYDDSLDVFGIHGVGGIVGALLTGVFASPDLGGNGIVDYSLDPDGAAAYAIGSQVIKQAWAVGVTVLWSGVVAFVALMIVKVVTGLRVGTQSEMEGLDLTSHGERAYNA